MKSWIVALIGATAALSARAAAPGAAKPVSLDAATLRRLGVAVATLQGSTTPTVASGFARVLDPIPLAQLDSDIAAAAPVASASAAEAARSRALFAADVTVSRKVAETATSQARGDAARLALLRRRLGLEWGPAIARLSDTQRAALVASLAAGRAALVRIDTAGGAGQSNLHAATIDLGPLGTVGAVILGPARTADPRLQSPGLLARISGPKAGLLSTGLTAPVRISGRTRRGVFVPAAAVLRLSGATWAFVQLHPGTFQRRQLSGTAPAPGGLFVSRGVRVGETIASRGAAALYAAEHGASAGD